MSHKIVLDNIADDLRVMYSTMTIREIAFHLGYAYVTVQRELARLGISDGRHSKFDHDFTERERDILIGTLLGDAYVGVNGRHTYLSLAHGPRQLEYIAWKVAELSAIFPDDWPRKRIRKNGTASWVAMSRTFPAMDEFHLAFYHHRKKVVPTDFIGQLSPLSIAVWYMDDGSLSPEGATIATMGFGREGTHILSGFLSDYGVRAKVSLAYGYPYLRLTLPETRKFVSLIAPHVHPSMSYKISVR